MTVGEQRFVESVPPLLHEIAKQLARIADAQTAIAQAISESKGEKEGN